MSSFKRFNSSNNSTDHNGNEAFEEGTLTWDSGNGLRLHDGYTSGGNSVGGFSGNFYDLNNRPSGTTALSDLIGGSSSINTGKFYQQTSTGQSDWGWAVPVWKSGVNVSNPEVSTPFLTISYYGQEVRIVNTSGANNAYMYQGRKITADGTVTQLTQTSLSINAADHHTITSLSAVGDMVILDALYDPSNNVVYRVTVMMAWSGTTHGQVSIEQIL
jgi:hypothetical protein